MLSEVPPTKMEGVGEELEVNTDNGNSSPNPWAS